MKKSILALLLSVSAISPVYAGCTQTNLTGTWAAFAATNNTAYFSGVGKGTVVVSSTGNVDSTKSTMVILYDYNTSPTATLTGKITVDTSCGISGSVSTPNTTYTLYGQLNNTKNAITGIYRSSVGDTGTMNFVKK